MRYFLLHKLGKVQVAILIVTICFLIGEKAVAFSESEPFFLVGGGLMMSLEFSDRFGECFPVGTDGISVGPGGAKVSAGEAPLLFKNGGSSVEVEGDGEDFCDCDDDESGTFGLTPTGEFTKTNGKGKGRALIYTGSEYRLFFFGMGNGTYNAYDSNGLFKSSVREGETIKTAIYDSAGRLSKEIINGVGTKTFSYGGHDGKTLLETVDSYGNKTTFQRDSSNQLTGAMLNGKQEFAVSYDTQNRISTVTKGSANSYSILYKQSSNEVDSITENNCATCSVDSSEGKSSQTFVFTNNGSGKTTVSSGGTPVSEAFVIRNSDGTKSVTQSNPYNGETKTFDRNGDLVKIIDNNGQGYTITRNSFGLPTQITSTSGKVLSKISYNSAHQILTQVQGNISSSNAYDTANNLVKTVASSPSGTYRTILTRDSLGRVTGQSNTSNHSSSTSIAYNGTTTTQTVFNKRGEPESTCEEVAGLDGGTEKGAFFDKSGNSSSFTLTKDPETGNNSSIETCSDASGNNGKTSAAWHVSGDASGSSEVNGSTVFSFSKTSSGTTSTISPILNKAWAYPVSELSKTYSEPAPPEAPLCLPGTITTTESTTGTESFLNMFGF